MKWLLACQCSPVSCELRERLIARGHDAWTCDVLPASDGSRQHIQSDAVEVAYDPCCRWDAMLAMPECRFLSSSGQHRTGKPGQRTQSDVEAAVAFFMKLVKAPIRRRAIENSVGIMSSRYRKPDQIVNPYLFGDDASKTTCLWLFDLPPLLRTRYIRPRWWCKSCKAIIPTALLPVCESPLCTICNGKLLPRWANQTNSGQNRLPPSPDRSAKRAQTYPGIMLAIDSQWGSI